MNYGLIGASGKLGTEVSAVFTEAGHKTVFKYDVNGQWLDKTPDILIDCSLPEVFNKVIEYAGKFNVPMVVATTGLTDENLKSLKDYSQKKPVVQSYNFSVGIQILLQLVKSAKEKLPDWDVEIIETHHRFKKDKPSGTAKMIENLFEGKRINTTSLRLGNIPGDHTVNFGGLGEVLSISHRALSRRTFAEGILLSAEFALNKKNGFYSFTDVIFGK